MTVKLFTYLVFTASLLSSFAQEPSYKVFIDSAKKNTYDTVIAFSFLEEAKLLANNSKAALEVRVAKGNIYSRNVVFEPAKKLLYLSFLEASKQGWDSLAAKSSFLLSIPLFNEGNLDSAIHHLTNATFYAEKARDSLVISMSLNNLGFAYETHGYLDSALNYYQKASKMLNSIEEFDQAAHAKMNMGYISQTQENNDLAIKYFTEAIQLANIKKGVKIVVYTHLALGDFYTNLQNEDSSLHYLKKAEQCLKGRDMPDLNQYIFSSLGDSNKEFKNYGQAINYYLKSLSIFEKGADSLGIMGLKQSIGEIYLLQNKINEAIKQLEPALKMAQSISDRESQKQVSRLLAQAYSKKSNWEKAYENISKTLELQEELASTERIASLQELQTKYETEKKDQEIENLSQQARIQTLEINQRNTQLFAIGVLIVVLLIAGTFFYRNRKLRHAQAVADMQQRMLRLQMNPHFIFNALASIQNYIIQSDTKESVMYLAKFGKLMRQILEHSREEFISIEEEVDMLDNYFHIQQLRFKNKFQFEIEVDEALNKSDTQIPPLFAQPFVENAIEHGLKNKQSDGQIIVRFQKVNNEVALEIIDNGMGLTKMVDISAEHKSLATKITRERLTILSERFKSNFALTVNNNSENGVVARLTLPTFQG